jgi:hypothetical protein
MMQQPMFQDGSVVKRNRMAKAILEYLQERENQWIPLRDLAYNLFHSKAAAIGDAVRWLSRREPIFTQTISEGKRKVKLVSYRPPPPDVCKYCRGKGCLVCGGTGRLA